MYTIMGANVFEAISPRSSEQVRSLVAFLAITADRLPHAQRSCLVTRYDHVYGDLTGQRALTTAEIGAFAGQYALNAEVSKVSFVLAIETYFAALCNLISASALSNDPSNYLRVFASLPDDEFKRKFELVVSGEEHVSYGLHHFSNAFELDWYLNELSGDILDSLKSIVGSMSDIWDITPLTNIDDPIQIIHDETFPRNLVHVTGQFYTPPWLCDLLAIDVPFSPDTLVIDPFCGSGAFLLSALRRLDSNGVSVEQAMRQVFGIDLNPSACIAARTNLVLYARKKGVRDFSSITINILCADSLAPAVADGERQANGLLATGRARILVDGNIIDSNPAGKGEIARVTAQLARCGFATDEWIGAIPAEQDQLVGLSSDDRKIGEQLAAFMLKRADVMLTNPPWVGWEYMSRQYRDYLNPAWETYGLFEQKGLQASFLKEDISTLCITAACDRYVKDDGVCSIVLRPAAMQSDLAARGLRRLSVFTDSGYLSLLKIRFFDDLQVFGNAAAPAASWHLKKGSKTQFPVPVVRWARARPRWQPSSLTPLVDVASNVREEYAVCSPGDPKDSSSRWSISGQEVDTLRETLRGSNGLKPRIGFFTGGANAIFYMQPLEKTETHSWKCQNIVERAKKIVEQRTFKLESNLVYSVARGRDISYWAYAPEVYVLCPHDAGTKMYPFSEIIMQETFPDAFSYISSFKDVLRDRNGFAGWEKKIHRDNYYTLQRIGEYTFAPFKVCWSYISEDFVISVIGNDERGKPVLPNDKVVFIGYNDEDEAYFTAGVLSSSPIRLSVISSTSARQVSTNVIKHLNIPAYDKGDVIHCKIAHLCKLGHKWMKSGEFENARIGYEEINDLVSAIYDLSNADMAAIKAELRKSLGYYPFKVGLSEKRKTRVQSMRDN